MSQLLLNFNVRLSHIVHARRGAVPECAPLSAISRLLAELPNVLAWSTGIAALEAWRKTGG